MKSILISIILAQSIAFGANERQEPAIQNDKPNIIFILSDDIGPGMIGCMGQKIIKTPNIDQLAKQGMMFTKVYSSQYCCPARASLLQGVHNRYKNSYTQTPGGLEIQRDKESWSREELNERAKQNNTVKPGEKEIFLPQMLQQAGYKTAQFGKLDWGFMSYHESLKRHGWDEYVGYYDHVKAHGFYPTYLWKNGKELPLKGNTHLNCGKTNESYGKGSTEKRRDRTGKETYAPDVLLDEALSFMQNNKNDPFFVFFATNLPHGPVDIPTKDNVYKNNPIIQQAYSTETGNNIECASAAEDYASMLHKLDLQVAALVKESQKIYKETKRPTIVFFSSDNGHEIYYRADKQGKTRSNEYHAGIFDQTKKMLDVFQGNRMYDPSQKKIIPLAGLKWTNYDGGTRVPLIVWCPGMIKPNSINTRLTAVYDHMATMADIAKVRMPEGKDGESYYNTLINKNKKTTSSRPFIIIDDAIFSSDGWKLIRGNKPQLFNLNKDPGEYTNLIDTNPEKAEELLSLYRENTGKQRRDK